MALDSTVERGPAIFIEDDIEKLLIGNLLVDGNENDQQPQMLENAKENGQGKEQNQQQQEQEQLKQLKEMEWAAAKWIMHNNSNNGKNYSNSNMMNGLYQPHLQQQQQTAFRCKKEFLPRENWDAWTEMNGCDELNKMYRIKLNGHYGVIGEKQKNYQQQHFVMPNWPRLKRQPSYGMGYKTRNIGPKTQQQRSHSQSHIFMKPAADQHYQQQEQPAKETAEQKHPTQLKNTYYYYNCSFFNKYGAGSGSGGSMGQYSPVYQQQTKMYNKEFGNNFNNRKFRANSLNVESNYAFAVKKEEQKQMPMKEKENIIQQKQQQQQKEKQQQQQQQNLKDDEKKPEANYLPIGFCPVDSTAMKNKKKVEDSINNNQHQQKKGIVKQQSVDCFNKLIKNKKNEFKQPTNKAIVMNRKAAKGNGDLAVKLAKTVTAAGGGQQLQKNQINELGQLEETETFSSAGRFQVLSRIGPQSSIIAGLISGEKEELEDKEQMLNGKPSAGSVQRRSNSLAAANSISSGISTFPSLRVAKSIKTNEKKTEKTAAGIGGKIGNQQQPFTSGAGIWSSLTSILLAFFQLLTGFAWAGSGEEAAVVQPLNKNSNCTMLSGGGATATSKKGLKKQCSLQQQQSVPLGAESPVKGAGKTAISSSSNKHLAIFHCLYLMIKSASLSVYWIFALIWKCFAMFLKGISICIKKLYRRFNRA